MMPNPPTSFNLAKMVISMAFLLLFFCGGCNAGGMGVSMDCSRKVGDCLLEEGLEMEMDSETNRRMVLWATEKKYISYEALKGDVVPCTKPGVPYYNCRVFPRANPYTRGCEMITGCARDANP